MIKLLIVDDEPLVQIGIKSMLNWADYGIEICGTAMNGVNALQMIEEYSPEIVITDIRMPIMNGLELAKTCREKYGKIPVFIILTSYEEFGLIKEAMSYQVADYLVKLELDAKSLAESVERSIERLTEYKESESYRASGRPLLQSYQDKFFMRLLHNLFDNEEQFLLQVKDLNLNFSDRCYLAAHGEIHEETAKTMSHSQLMNLYASSLQMIREILTKHLPCYVISLDMKRFSVIFHFADIEKYDNNLLKNAIDNACNMVHNYFNVWITMGLGSSADHPLKISESYQEARQAFSLTDREHPVLNYSQATPDSVKNSFNISLFKNDITRAFEEFDTDILDQTLTEIMELFATNPMRDLQAVDGACNILYLAISLLPEGEATLNEIFSGFTDGYRSIYRAKNVEQVIEWLTLFKDGLCETLKSKKKTYKDHVVTNVQKYIKNHVEEKLGLNEVAAVFGLSPNYLSVLFKKNCGIGFSEYTTQQKISRAKALLLEQDMKVYEVADQLGFESAFYFSKVFKKVEGISPREFIQQKTNTPTIE